MSAAKEIQAAIDKLAAQKVASTDGPWAVWHPVSKTYYGNSSVDAPTEDPDNPIMVVEGGQREDINLIVTLHGTINAQLLILRNGPNSTDDATITEAGRAYDAVALILARAINGATA